MWLARCDAKDGCCEQGGCLLYLVVAETLRAIIVLFGNKLRVPVAAIFFFILHMFHPNTKSNCAVIHYYLIIRFKNCLCSIGNDRNVSDADVSVIVP